GEKAFRHPFSTLLSKRRKVLIMSRLRFLSVLLSTLVLSVCLFFGPPAYAASHMPNGQTHREQLSSPAVTNCAGPIVLTFVVSGTTICWYSEGYHGINPNWENVTYFHSDQEVNTFGWFLIYLHGTAPGTGTKIFFSADVTLGFSIPNKITQVCLGCTS